jgi:hypothetical protein
MIRIQVKVYDETGRRQYANDIKIPINLEEALEYVKEEGKRLNKIVEVFETRGN